MSSYPGKPAATIFLNGLLCLCFNGKTQSTVAVNKRSSHRFAFEIYKKKEPKCELVKKFENFQKIEIAVQNSVSSMDGVYVYNGPDFLPPPLPTWDTRKSYVDYCIDLEKAYGTSLPEKSTKPLGPRVFIDNGLFCAYKVSESTFELEGSPVPLGRAGSGNIALGVAVDIFMKDPGSITFTVDGSAPPFKLDWTSPDEYEIGITNACDGCTFTPKHPTDKRARNDFWMHYESLKLPTGKGEFNLRCITELGSAAATILGQCINTQTAGSPFSDPAPCMPILLGQSTSI